MVQSAEKLDAQLRSDFAAGASVSANDGDGQHVALLQASLQTIGNELVAAQRQHSIVNSEIAMIEGALQEHLYRCDHLLPPTSYLLLSRGHCRSTCTGVTACVHASWRV